MLGPRAGAALPVRASAQPRAMASGKDVASVIGEFAVGDRGSSGLRRAGRDQVSEREPAERRAACRRREESA